MQLILGIYFCLAPHIQNIIILLCNQYKNLWDLIHSFFGLNLQNQVWCSLLQYLSAWASSIPGLNSHRALMDTTQRAFPVPRHPSKGPATPQRVQALASSETPGFCLSLTRKQASLWVWVPIYLSFAEQRGPWGSCHLPSLSDRGFPLDLYLSSNGTCFSNELLCRSPMHTSEERVAAVCLKKMRVMGPASFRPYPGGNWLARFQSTKEETLYQALVCSSHSSHHVINMQNNTVGCLRTHIYSKSMKTHTGNASVSS